MPAEESSAAIVLRARDYSESDRVVTLLTREFGKIGGIAKGAKKSRARFERKLEPFSHVMLYFRRRPHGQLVFVTRAEAADLPQFQIDGDIGRFALGSYMLELTDALASEEAEAAGAYAILSDALAALSRHTPSPAMRHAFELKMLKWAGYGLEFRECRKCGAASDSNGGAMFFVAAHGGVVCSRCRPSIGAGGFRMDAKGAALLARLAGADFGHAASVQHCDGDGAIVIARFIAGVLDRKLRSVEFLDSILPAAKTG